MSISNTTAMRIKIEQLQAGVFIRLDESWFNHPLLFTSFKIKNLAQVDSVESYNGRGNYFVDRNIKGTGKSR